MCLNSNSAMSSAKKRLTLTLQLKNSKAKFPIRITEVLTIHSAELVNAFCMWMWLRGEHPRVYHSQGQWLNPQTLL